MTSSGNKQNGDEQTALSVYHSHHSYLFFKVIERYPQLTTEELEKEFKANIEGAYVTELLDEYGDFYQISRDHVAAFKAFVADEMIWRRYREYSLNFAWTVSRARTNLLSLLVYDKPEEKNPEAKLVSQLETKPEVGLSLEQGKALVTKYKAHIAELKEQLAAEKKKVQDADMVIKCNQQAMTKLAMDAGQAEAENKRLKEEIVGYKRNEEIQYEKFEDVNAARMDLEKDVERRYQVIKDLQDKVGKLKQGKEELQKDNAKLKQDLAEAMESEVVLKSSLDHAMAELDLSRDTVFQVCDTEKKLEKELKKKITELEARKTELEERNSYLEQRHSELEWKNTNLEERLKKGMDLDS